MFDEQEKIIYRVAKSFIIHKGHWTQGVCARDRFGNPAQCGTHEAYAWCSLGALYEAHHSLGIGGDLYVASILEKFYKFLNSRNDGTTNILSLWNDTHTHEEVIQLWEDFGKSQGCD